jgi:hypothetical protein
MFHGPGPAEGDHWLVFGVILWLGEIFGFGAKDSLARSAPHVDSTQICTMKSPDKRPAKVSMKISEAPQASAKHGVRWGPLFLSLSHLPVDCPGAARRNAVLCPVEKF